MEKINFKKEAEQMNVIKAHGRQHVIRIVERSFYKNIPDPNYMHTGQALVGILRDHETLEQFRAEWVKKEIERDNMFKSAPKNENWGEIF